MRLIESVQCISKKHNNITYLEYLFTRVYIDMYLIGN